MNQSSIISASFLLLGASAIAAVESGDAHTDLRLEGILLPESYDYDATANSGLGSVSLSGDDDFDRPFRLGISAITHHRGIERGPVGLVAGGALYYTRLPVDDDDTSERYEALSAQVRIGLGIYLADFFHIEATPFAGIGGCRASINGDDSDTGLTWEYGISGGAFATLGNSLQLGLLGGWIHSEYDLDFDQNDNFAGPVDDVQVDIDMEGFFIGASVGVRL